MSYVEKILLPDERVLCITTIHGIVYFQGLAITTFGGLFAFLIPSVVDFLLGPEGGQGMVRWLDVIAFVIVTVGVALLIFAYAKQIATELAVTNRRVIAKYGIIGRTTYEIMVDRITGANFDQSLVGRLLGYGTVIVHGAGGDISPFERIGNPEGFHKALMQVLERGQIMVKRPS